MPAVSVRFLSSAGTGQPTHGGHPGRIRTLSPAALREICLIAQDTTSYGKDLYGGFRLAELLRSLKETGPDAWFRVMYAFPRYLSDEILETLAATAPLPVH